MQSRGGGERGFDHVLGFPRKESLRRAHMDQTLESWEFGELCVLNVKVKKPLLLPEQFSGVG